MNALNKTKNSSSGTVWSEYPIKFEGKFSFNWDITFKLAFLFSVGNQHTV